MPRLHRKNFATPDLIRTFPTGNMDIVKLDEIEIGRFVFGPGWRWSKDVAPIARTASCQHRHLGYTISGSLHVRMDDGTELTISAGDAYEIPPGHDAWIVGDKRCVMIDVSGAANYAIYLGCAFVAGRKRVPRPAAGKTALRIFWWGLVAEKC